jgi:hypothetical protein
MATSRARRKGNNRGRAIGGISLRRGRNDKDKIIN